MIVLCLAILVCAPCALLWQASADVGPDELPYYAALHKARVYQDACVVGENVGRGAVSPLRVLF